MSMLRNAVTVGVTLAVVLINVSDRAHGQVIQATPVNEQNVTLSLTSYRDLVNRMDTLERQVGQGWQEQSKYGGKDTCEPYQTGRYVQYDHVIVMPFFSENNAFSITNTMTADSGQIVDFDHDFEYSPRIEFGYFAPSDGLGWRARFWHYEGHETEATSSPAIVALSDDPQINIDSDAGGTLFANYDLRFTVADLEAVKRNYGESSVSSVAAGMRFAAIDHDYTAREFGGANALILAGTESNVIGPTIAWEGRQLLCGRRFDAFMSTRASALFGETDFIAHKVAGATSGGIVRIDDRLQVIPVGEIQMGVDYREPLNDGIFFMRFAVEAQYWLNGGTGAVLGPEDSTTDGEFQDPTNEDTGFFGVNLSTGFLY
ncbi:MAG: Lpg1974 family pore-forming outer membrane protein [Pirellulaceae bacterium]|jgi:hypothetical protein|nr:Lpg1974 family pore-forming outer membrane protein [Pirellulaceae bacterium]MDP7014491.1 Lpg1974 family pore-forming outer membrane protein [Pirellulaceae bacterium]